MDTSTNIRSTEPLKLHNVRQSQRPAPRESDSAGNSANPAFGLLVCQLLGTAQQSSPPAIRGGDNSEHAGSIPLSQTSAPSPGVQDQEEGTKGEAAAPQALALPSNERIAKNESAGPVAGENGSPDKIAKGDEEPDKAAAPLAPEPLPNKSAVKKNAAELASLEKMSTDDTANVEQGAPSDKKLFYLASQAGDSDAQQGPAGSLIKAETGEKRSGTGTIDADTEKTDYASLVKNESSAALQLSGPAAGERGPGTMEESRHVHVRAENPVDKAEHTVSIIKDGDRLAVKLEPEGLGKININLSLDNGKIHAQINVHDSTTKNLIESNMRQIVDALLKEGLTVGGFSVSLNNGDAGQHMVERFWKNAGKGTGSSLGPINSGNKTEAMGLVNIYA